MKTLLKIFAAVGFGLTAAVVGMLAFGLASGFNQTTAVVTTVFTIAGALAGWYRVK